MAEDDIATELASLRAQLQKLDQDRNRRESPMHDSPPVTEPLASPAAIESITREGESWLDGLEGLEPDQILERLKAGAGDWFDELNSDFKDIKPSSVLTIFGLGVLIGRLTH